MNHLQEFPQFPSAEVDRQNFLKIEVLLDTIAHNVRVDPLKRRLWVHLQLRNNTNECLEAPLVLEDQLHLSDVHFKFVTEPALVVERHLSESSLDF